MRNISVMGEPGDGYGSHAELRYTNVRVPAEKSLGGDEPAYDRTDTPLGQGVSTIARAGLAFVSVRSSLCAAAPPPE
ncbi:MAG: hypothetical protein R3E66_15570 [bacterium]